ncbi:hypothetical protein QYM36_000452 [Artemia franciscana]|uniref:Uncharacterized protein n=1 Tax=Artemia franciscana TaxID=6661 RepID=A0AA88I858_ARTSF|nr:hypothetical protein QYM36_000452 [Artemia franciscana]
MNQEANRSENLAIKNEEETISHPSSPPDISEKVESWIKGSMDKMSPENTWVFIDLNSDTESILSERDRHIVLGSVGEYIESLAGDLVESVVSKDETEIVLRPLHRVAMTPRQERLVCHNEEYLTEADFYGIPRSFNIDSRKTDDTPGISQKFQDSSAEILDEDATTPMEQRKLVATDMKHHTTVNHKVDHLTEAEFYERSESLNIYNRKADDRSKISDKF